MAATEVETPVKMCLTVLEKKVRNLEKRKGKLESYQEKLTSGEELNKDQLEAIAKYNEVLQTLEFSRDLQKQFQSLSVEVDKMQRKQSKKEKAERQQSELLRLQEVLHLQTLLDLLGDDELRERLKSVPGDLVVTDDSLNELDEFYQLIAPSRDDSKFGQQACSAAEHIQLYLDRSDRTVVGAATYCSLHELIDRLELSNFLQAELSNKSVASSNKDARQIADESQSETGQQQLTLVQQTSPEERNIQHSDIASGITESSTMSFLAEPSGDATPWSAQSSVEVAVQQTPPVSDYDCSNYFGAVAPSASQSHRVEVTSYPGAPSASQSHHVEVTSYPGVPSASQSHHVEVTSYPGVPSASQSHHVEVTSYPGAPSASQSHHVEVTSYPGAPSASHLHHVEVTSYPGAPSASQLHHVEVTSYPGAPSASQLHHVNPTSYAVSPSASQLHHVDPTSYAQQIARQSRPLQDIVSSLQGSFHFLQESQIELENQSLLSSARNAESYAFTVASAAPVGSIEQYQTHSISTTHNHSTSPHQFYYQTNAAALFGAQHRVSPDQHLGSSFLVSSDVGRQLVSSTDESCPMPIPLPSEVIHGQSLTRNSFNASQLSNSPVSKQFSMNPNANVFHSVYEPTSALLVDAKSGVQGESALNDLKFTSTGHYDEPHEHSNYSGRHDNGYSRGNRVVNDGSVYSSGFNAQRSAGSKNNTPDSSSTRGVARGRRGSGFNQSGRVRQHMAA